jgi:3-oxoacyl-[acyl-carrier protein] reductase
MTGAEVIGPGRRALVTGGAGGIGAAICRRLARSGHHVHIHAHRSSEQAEALAQELTAAGARATAVCFDVTDAAATHAALEQLLAAGPIQILVNNAAVHADAVLPGMSALQWQRVIDVSLHGFFHVTQPLLLPMIRTRWGRILTLSSVSAQIGNRGQVNYAAAKGALIAATRALALEVATRGITVNAIAPGIIASGMSEGSFDADAVSRLVPMQRAGSAEEVASLVDFLAGEGAAYITGQVVSINGGMY